MFELYFIFGAGLVILVMILFTLFKAIHAQDKQLDIMVLCLDEIHKEITRQNFIDKNLENFKIGSLKYILIGTRLYISAIMEQATREERFEDAQRCKNAINEISKLINF